MHSYIKPFLFISVILTSGLYCASTPKSPTPTAQWFSNMHRLSVSHLSLMPVLANPNQMADPDNQEGIRNSLRDLVQAANDITKDQNTPGADPLISYTAGMLALDSRQALVSFEAGDYPGVRYSLNRVSGYCISCHTRADRGAKDFDLAWTPNLQRFNALQRIDFLLANRQYAKAINEALVLAKDKDAAQKDSRGWLLAIERVLAMLIRVNEDQPKAKELVRQVINNTAAPFYNRMDAIAWRQDIDAWGNESKPKTTAERYRRVVRLVKQAERYGSIRSRAGLVLNLRASALLHQFLENPNSAKYAEYLFYAGVVSQSLHDLQLGALDQYYFESCIRVAPHTQLAGACYSNLEQSVYQANPFLELEPNTNWAIQARLVELRKLSEVTLEPSEPLWKQRQLDRGLPEANP